ncbi:MAG: hypothetical protein J6T27_00525 [Alphaproteobacteria bacterium]|nr:hypothetical protein [Alphaproteobacteria bacterium]
MPEQNEIYDEETLQKIEQMKQTSLWATIQKKLKEKELASNVKFFLGLLNRLADERQRPSLDDRVANELAPYYVKAKDKEKQSEQDKLNVAAKRVAYNRALDDGAVAYVGFKQAVPLGSPDAEFNDVEYIAGLWRVQKKFPYKITQVRDRQFVLVKKLPRAEKNKFEYYTAAAAIWSGTGCSADVAKPDWIVAKYETPNGVFMAYGQTIEQARAFLAISIYDGYQDLIHDAAFENANQK